MLTELRDSIDLSPQPIFVATQLTQKRLNSSRQRRPTMEEEDSNDVIVLMDVIRISMTSNRKIGDSWLRAVEGVKYAKDHRPLDVFLCVILYMLPNRQKAVESLFKNKIRHGLFTEDFVKKTFSCHKKSLKPHFDTILTIAESLMHSMEPVLHGFSTVIFREMFLNFDRCCQQEIVADLVTKISSGSSDSVKNTSIATLEYLATHHTDRITPYAIFTSSVLDYIDTLELGQVRRVMDVLSLLAYSCPSQASVLRQDIHIVVRKQMSLGSGSSKAKLKRMGVIGAVVTVKNMAYFASNDRVETSFPSQESSVASSTVPISVLKQAREILEQVKDTAKAYGDIYGLFMDELSCVVESGKIDTRLEKWIADTMANDFQDEFVVDFSAEDFGGKRRQG